MSTTATSNSYLESQNRSNQSNSENKKIFDTYSDINTVITLPIQTNSPHNIQVKQINGIYPNSQSIGTYGPRQPINYYG